MTGIQCGIIMKHNNTVVYRYSKTPLLRPPLSLRKNGLYSGVVLLLSLDKEEINEM